MRRHIQSVSILTLISLWFGSCEQGEASSIRRAVVETMVTEVNGEENIMSIPNNEKRRAEAGGHYKRARTRRPGRVDKSTSSR